MFTLIQAHEIDENRDLIDLAHKLRKKVFADQLEWDVPVDGEIEIDEYDNENAHYLIWCSDDRKVLFGHIRLIATVHPTLLFDVFGRTHGNDPTLVSDDIFEGTRMCVDEDAIARHLPQTDARQAFNLLFLSLCEAALALGVRRLVSNFEPAMSRIYRRAGLSYKVHGKSHGYGRQPVYCASFAVSKAVLKGMREKLAIDLPLFRKGEAFVPAIQHGEMAA